MAGELQALAPTGSTVYGQVINESTGQIWNTAGTPAFENYATANIADYDVAMTEQGTASGFFKGNKPAFGAVLVTVMYRIRAGGSPAEPDILTHMQSIDDRAGANLANVSANVVQWLGTAASTPTVAGVPNINVKTWNDLTTVALPLVPTTAGRTLDVSADGEAGLDWANVGSPTTTVGLTNTTVGVVTLVNTVTTYTGNTVQTGDSFARIGAAGAGLTAIDLPNQTMDIVGNITGNLSGSVGSVTGAVGSVTGLTAATVHADLDDIQARLPAALTAGGNIKADALAWNALATVELPLVPTTAGRKLDVSAGGEAGLDWANVGSPTSTVDLTNTTVGIVTLVNTLTTYTGNTVQTGDSFARIGVAGAGLTNIDLPNQTMDIVGNITGNLSGSVGSVTGTVGSVTGLTVATVHADLDDIQMRLPAALVSGRMDSSVGAYPGNTPQTGDVATLITTVGVAGAGLTAVDDATLAAIAALNNLSQGNIRTAVGLASANLDTQLGTIAGYIDTEVASVLAAVDTEVAAIKAKTDGMTFTVAGFLDSNIQYVNDVAVQGTGASGNEWGPV
jgi:hypothetical protein